MKKLIFDVDGTILDSMHIWINPQNELFSKYGFVLEDLSAEKKGIIEALSYEDMCQYIADEIATDMTYQEVVDHFDQIIINAYKNELMPKEGNLEKLKELKEAGYKMSVASSTPFRLIEMALKRLGVFDYFDFFATPDIVKSKKSEPEFWIYSYENHKAAPEDCILFDDALYAIKAAKKEGIKTIGLEDFPWNKNEWDQIVDDADMVIKSLADLDIKDLK